MTRDIVTPAFVTRITDEGVLRYTIDVPTRWIEDDPESDPVQTTPPAYYGPTRECTDDTGCLVIVFPRP